MRKTTANIFFRLILLLFSALLAVLTLLTGIDLTAEGERVAAQNREISALEEENERLRVQIECATDLETLEEYAIRVLGMQRCGQEQIIVIDLEG